MKDERARTERIASDEVVTSDASVDVGGSDAGREPAQAHEGRVPGGVIDWDRSAEHPAGPHGGLDEDRRGPTRT